MQDSYAEVQDTNADVQDSYADVQDTYADVQDTYADVQDTYAAVQDAYADVQDLQAYVQDSYAEVLDTYAYVQDSYADVKDIRTQADVQDMSSSIQFFIELCCMTFAGSGGCGLSYHSCAPYTCARNKDKQTYSICTTDILYTFSEMGIKNYIC